MTTKIDFISAILLMLTFLTSCLGKDHDTGGILEEEILISGITIADTPYNSDPTTLCLLQGDRVKLDISLTPATGITSPDVVWSSDDSSVASVSQDGTVTADAIGTTIVRVMPVIGFGAVPTTPTRTVKVIDHYVYMDNITIGNVPEGTIAVGETVALTATPSPDDVTFVKYTWASSNPSVATIDENGTVTGKADGITTITVTADDRNPETKVSATCQIEVEVPVNVETLEIPNDSYLTQLGYSETYQIKFNVTPADATLSTIQWSSDNPDAISVDNKGVLTVHTFSAASAIITATTGTITRTVNAAVAAGRLWFSFANSFEPWRIDRDGASVGGSDGTKTTIIMNNQGTTSSRRGDIALIKQSDNITMSITPSEYRYIAVKFAVNHVLRPGSSAGCFKLEMFDNPRTIGPYYVGTENANNSYTLFTGNSFSPSQPNVFYYDLQSRYDEMTPTDWNQTFNLVQFLFVIADYPGDGTCDTYDIYWVRAFKSLEELATFVSSEN
jgi:uncharacterized protein YjdB